MRNPRSLISRALLLPRPPPLAAAAVDPRRPRRGAARVESGPRGARRSALVVADAGDRGGGEGAAPAGARPQGRRALPVRGVPLLQQAFLDYHDIPYRVVEVNPLSKKEIKWSDYKKVPILVVDGERLIDSSDIINKLSKRISADDFVISEEEAKWRRWVDEHLVHLLSPNIYRSTSEALESFDYISKHGNFSATERFAVKYAGAAAMYMVSKKLKKKYNITDERTALYEAAETWMKALDGRDYLGGSKPNLADLAVFGVLRPIRYLQAGRDMVENTHIGEWYQRMENAVGEPARIMA